MPAFIREGSDTDRRKCTKEFERAYDWVQDRLVDGICAYAELWLKSEGGKDYRDHEIRAT